MEFSGIASDKDAAPSREAVTGARGALMADGRYAAILATWGVGGNAAVWLLLNGSPR